MRQTTRQDYLERMDRVLRRIRERLDDPLTPEELASVACFSRCHFSRLFKGMTGETVGELVRRLRLERAAVELRRTREPVLRIAMRAGYAGNEPFTRAFRAHFGRSPSEHRAMETDPGFPPSLCGVHFGAAGEFVPMHEENTMIDVRIEEAPSLKLIAMEHRGEYMKMGDTMRKLMDWAVARGVATEDAMGVGVYYDDPETVPAEKLRAEACITAPPGFEPGPDDPVRLIETRAGPHAIATHKGPYDKLGESYRWLFGQWLPTSGREPGEAPPYEIYLNNCWELPPEELLTEIYIPLK